MIDKQFISRISFSMILPFIRFSYGFLLAMILSKNLSLSDYGEWSFFISMIGLVLTFSSLSLMYSSQVIFQTRDKIELKQDINSIMVFKVLFTLFLGLLFGLYGYIYELFSKDIAILFFIVIFFRTIADLTFGLLRALLKIKAQVLFFFIESVLIISFIFYSVSYISNDISHSIYSFLYAEIIASLFGIYLLKNYISLINVFVNL